MNRTPPMPSSLFVAVGANARTVLIVEDDHHLLTLLQGWMCEFGYNVIGACNGRMALQCSLVYSGQIDLLLTDIGMPGLDGICLASEIRKLRESIKVLYMTGYDGSEISAGSAPVLQKPVSMDVLRRAIMKSLKPDSSDTRYREIAIIA